MRTAQLVTAAAIVAGLTACQPAADGNDAAGSPAPTASAKQPVSKPVPADGQVLGPRGFGALRLGMTKAQAVATGSLSGLEDTGCWGATISGPGAPKDGSVTISKGHGLVLIVIADHRVRTPEGISLGATLTEVKRAYPGLTSKTGSEQSQSVAAVPGNPSAHYQFSRTEADPAATVDQISLVDNNQDCFD
jgi:hypothetical protein